MHATFSGCRLRKPQPQLIHRRCWMMRQRQRQSCHLAAEVAVEAGTRAGAGGGDACGAAPAAAAAAADEALPEEPPAAAPDAAPACTLFTSEPYQLHHTYKPTPYYFETFASLLESVEVQLAIFPGSVGPTSGAAGQQQIDCTTGRWAELPHDSSTAAQVLYVGWLQFAAQNSCNCPPMYSLASDGIRV